MDEVVSPKELSLFEATGIEIEYMIVDRETLDVKPIADQILGGVSEIESGEISWSNELVSHVIELKTNGPARDLEAAPEDGPLVGFERDVRRIDEMLAPLGARLLPTAMHPWMDPLRETVLWPHEYSPVYSAYDRIFNCSGHGWSNLQSVHINLPFSGDEEFARLHAAIRLILPILPALAASSPLVEGRPTNFLDNRMEFYRTNTLKIPSINGGIIPEPIYTQHAYEQQIFQRLYRDIAPHDPEGVLRGEFLNSRGAIARFDRGAIEIRVIDVQECPLADLAITVLVKGVLKLLTEERWTTLEEQKEIETEPLARLFRRSLVQAEETKVYERDYLEALGIQRPALYAGEIWAHLLSEVFDQASPPDEAWRDVLEPMVERGTLAREIRRYLGAQPSREEIRAVYSELADCLVGGELFGV